MNRRNFIFRSLKASLLLNPVLSIRLAEAQTAKKMKAFFFVDGGSYPVAEDFFPGPTNSLANLSPILGDFAPLKSDIVIVDGINIKDSGPNPKGNNHVRSVGKVLTARNVIDIGNNEAVPGGISIDQIIAQGLMVPTLEVMIHTSNYNSMRARPFALGSNQFKPPLPSAADAWDKVFGGFQPAATAAAEDPAAKQKRIADLTARKSLLDDLVVELQRFRGELVGVEKLKLDIHEDAIRKAELSVSEELKAASTNSVRPQLQCTLPAKEGSNDIPLRSKAHFDVMYAAFLCDRIGVGGMMFGYSSIQWRYEWINLGLTNNIHDQVYHRLRDQRQKHVLATKWNFSQLAQFAQRLKSTPDGSSNMLDNVLIYATSFFGMHHKLEQIPLMLIGNAQGKLKTGRVIKIASRPEAHAQILTSTARLCGVNINGVGDDAQSGPLAELGA